MLPGGMTENQTNIHVSVAVTLGMEINKICQLSVTETKTNCLICCLVLSQSLLLRIKSKPPPKKKVKNNSDAKLPTVRSVLAEVKENSGPSDSINKQDKSAESRNTSLVEIELDMTSTEQNKLSGYQREHYSVASLSTEVIHMETGLPIKEVFDIIVNYVARFKGHINYYSEWKER